MCTCLDRQSLVYFPGQSGIDFLFDFVQFFQGASEGFDVLENRPASGKP